MTNLIFFGDRLANETTLVSTSQGSGITHFLWRKPNCGRFQLDQRSACLPYHAYLATYTKTQLEKSLKNKYIWIPELGNRTRDINNIQLVDEEKGLQKLLELARM
jgi:hypothetical protein